MVVDTHTHLNMDRYDDDLPEVIKRAEEAGVGLIIDVGVDVESSQKSIQISERFKSIFSAVGCHPHDAVKMKEKDFCRLERLLNHDRVVAVGEIGLDYHYNFSPPEVQREVFKRQLEMASEKNLPVIVHMREAMRDGIKIMENYYKKVRGGVFHCFGGGVEHVHKVVEMGFFISFTGVITFHNFNSFKKVESVPLNRLLLETDSPYMAPVPERGKRNEPAFIVHIIKVLSSIYRTSEEDIATVTTDNAVRLFELKR